MDEVENFFFQFPNPWALRVSGMGGYNSKCEKSQNHCTLVDKDSVFTSLHLRYPVYVVPPQPALRDFGHVGVLCTFCKIPPAAAAAVIVRPRSLAAHWQGRRYNIVPQPLSSS